MKSASLTHDKRISKKQTTEEMHKKKYKYYLEIKSADSNRWYNGDGSTYKKETSEVAPMHKEIALHKWIKELEIKLEMNKNGKIRMT